MKMKYKPNAHLHHLKKIVERAKIAGDSIYELEADRKSEKLREYCKQLI